MFFNGVRVKVDQSLPLFVSFLLFLSRTDAVIHMKAELDVKLLPVCRLAKARAVRELSPRCFAGNRIFLLDQLFGVLWEVKVRVQM